VNGAKLNETITKAKIASLRS